MPDAINILYAATSDFLPLATVSAISVLKNLSSNVKLNIYFLYADIVKDISDTIRNNIFETAKATFDEHGIGFNAINVIDLMPLLQQLQHYY